MTTRLLGFGAVVLVGVTACGSDSPEATPVGTVRPTAAAAAPDATHATHDAGPAGSAEATEATEATSTAPPTSTVEPTDAATPEEGGTESTITIADFDYEVPVSVEAGSEVTVVNDDVEAHTVTSSPPGAFDLNVLSGETGTFTAPTEPGEYRFVCLLHGGMEAVLVVT